ncbi:MAG: type IV pilus biogenesis/stability protein PilW, partial [Spongiibacter sp.]|nr:type IV pilus biogenesis/stability protein PilW [Spongiibacter sp.]
MGNGIGFYRNRRALFLTICSAFLSACVTTHSGGFAEKADEKKAFETSVQLAKTYIAQGNWEQAKRHLQYVESVDRSNA